MNLSEKVLQLRKTNGLSQDDLANKLGVTRQSVSKWESGQAMPELDKVLSLAEIFEVSTDYLLQPNETDEIRLKTTRLEKQQQIILKQQQKQANRQFLIISSFIALLAVVIVYLLGHYIAFPDVGDGYGFLGKTLMYCGIIAIIAVTVALNFRYRIKLRNKDIE